MNGANDRWNPRSSASQIVGHGSPGERKVIITRTRRKGVVYNYKFVIDLYLNICVRTRTFGKKKKKENFSDAVYSQNVFN